MDANEGRGTWAMTMMPIRDEYAGRPIHYFGEAIPARFAETEIPVLCLIRPTHVVALDATGGGPR